MDIPPVHRWQGQRSVRQLPPWTLRTAFEIGQSSQTRQGPIPLFFSFIDSASEAFDPSKMDTDVPRGVDRLQFGRAKRAFGVLVRIVLQFEARFSRSRLGFFRVLPAGHYGSGWDLEPEKAAHARDVGSREYYLAALLSNVSLCLIEILNENVVCASRNLRFLS